jgi:hypothetical protein
MLDACLEKLRLLKHFESDDVFSFLLTSEVNCAKFPSTELCKEGREGECVREMRRCKRARNYMENEGGNNFPPLTLALLQILINTSYI